MSKLSKSELPDMDAILAHIEHWPIAIIQKATAPSGKAVLHDTREARRNLIAVVNEAGGKQ